MNKFVIRLPYRCHVCGAVWNARGDWSDPIGMRENAFVFIRTCDKCHDDPDHVGAEYAAKHHRWAHLLQEE